MFIQLLVESTDDERIIIIEQHRYKFKRNEHGDLVCNMAHPEHEEGVLKLFPKTYKQYAAPVAAQEEAPLVVGDDMARLESSASNPDHVHADFAQLAPPQPQKAETKKQQRR
jgi:hypothetical protein